MAFLTRWAAMAAVGWIVVGCGSGAGTGRAGANTARADSAASSLAGKVAQYTSVRLTADLRALSERERRMLPLLIDAATEMDSVYQQQKK